MRVVHLYPFVPRGRHGGTLRLAAAVEASAALGETEVHYFDSEAGSWQGPLAASDLATMVDGAPGREPRSDDSLKRGLLPSTLWESGRRSRSVLERHAERLRLGGEAVLFVHTTYLAPALAALPRPLASLVDVYDLVWSAHQNDAAAAAGPLRALRLAYGAATRRRELAALATADALVAAGVADAEKLGSAGLTARWIPTATPVAPVAPRDAAGSELRVGLLGNFAHISTRKSLEALMRSPLARNPSVRIVVAGLHADRVVQATERVDVLGAIARAEDFYALVDCVVALVLGGSGIKVKLAEGILAGRPVITTALGTAGYPKDLRRWFHTCEPDELDGPTVLEAVRSADPAAARAAFEAAFSRHAVARAYQESIRAVVGR